MIQLLYIDLFCGAGGTSTGVNEARLYDEQCARVIACVNHDPTAIASHAANHPDALHFIEDIRTLNLTPLMKHIKACRKEYPQALIVLWASLECTNFSRAKGGQPRDPDSRTLAEHLYRYIEAINPDFIQIENVEEFMAWGPLDKNGRPLSMDRGRDYVRWIKNVKGYGYSYDYRILNSADYGARTTRKRYFGMFAKKSLPIVFPTPTHSRRPTGNLERWRAVRYVLNLEEIGQSIFTRKKPLAENTLKRIYAGLVKFVPDGSDAFMVKFNSMSQRGKYVPPSIDEPCGCVTTNPKHRLVTVRKHFLVNPQFNSAGRSIDEPCFTLIARMDKRPPCLVTTENGEIAIEVYETDSPMMIKIKEFMAKYGLADIYMRMLKVVELKRIQGFPDDYVLMGNQSDQKKFIGNAVHTSIPKAWCPVLCRAILKLQRQSVLQ